MGTSGGPWGSVQKSDGETEDGGSLASTST